MRTSELEVGQVYAHSPQRDAVIGNKAFAFRPVRVVAIGVHRDENIHGDTPERTDGVRVQPLGHDGSDIGDTEVIRSRSIKGRWDDHQRALTIAAQAARQALVREHKAQEAASARARELAGDLLTSTQLLQVTPEALSRAESYEVLPVGQGLHVVRSGRVDTLVLLLEPENRTALQVSQEGKGGEAQTLEPLTVVKGSDDVAVLLAVVMSQAPVMV